MLLLVCYLVVLIVHWWCCVRANLFLFSLHLQLSLSLPVRSHPNGKDFIYPAGGCLVVCDFNDPHNQVFLRGHDDDLSAVALSRGGSLLATGQVGLNADVVVWRYGEGELKSALYRFSEHDHGISCLAFSKTKEF